MDKNSHRYKRNTTKSIVNVVIIVIICALLYTAVSLILKYINFENCVINFRVNGEDLSDALQINEIKEYLESNHKVALGDCDITESLWFEADTSKLDNMTFKEYLDIEDSNINIVVHVVNINKGELKNILKEFNTSHTKTEDAYISMSYGDNVKYLSDYKLRYKVIDEVQGVNLDIDKVLNDVNTENIDKLNYEEYLVKPQVVKEDLQGIVDEANRYVDWTVSYDSGQEFTSNIEYVRIVDNNTRVEIKDEFIKDIVKELEMVYDTAGKGFEFTKVSGEEIEATGGTYGNIMNSQEEREYLTELFKSGTSEYDRKPIMKQELPSEIGNSYIEVSIDEQHLWFFKDGELVSETDVVTGDSLKDRDTPKGVFFISEMINGKYLTGDTYRTWVNKWMRLTNSGVGLHDAGWRGRFGGNIYKGDGSHGCINLPKKYAYDLFDQATRKMPVIIY